VVVVVMMMMMVMMIAIQFFKVQAQQHGKLWNQHECVSTAYTGTAQLNKQIQSSSSGLLRRVVG
jgi:conjugal transfer/entry exclusion protein